MKIRRKGASFPVNPKKLGRGIHRPLHTDQNAVQKNNYSGFNANGLPQRLSDGLNNIYELGPNANVYKRRKMFKFCW